MEKGGYFWARFLSKNVMYKKNRAVPPLFSGMVVLLERPLI
jgi:hypothetical protein